MRDHILTLLLVAGLPLSLIRPYFGALIFAWLGLMNPHRLTWSYAETIPWSMLYAVVTLIGIAFAREKIIGRSISAYWLPLAYLAWMTVTSYFALQPTSAWERFDGIWKVQLMCVCSLALLLDRRKIEWFAAIAVLSIIFYGVKGGFFTITSGGAHRVWGPAASVINDNNQLATGLITASPFLYWLYYQTERVWLRRAIIVAGILTLFSVLGSHSRGAFLGLSSMGMLLWFKSRNKLPLLLFMIPVVAIAFAFMPDEYWTRIESIVDYTEDGSATGRLNTWQTALNIANSRITGGGLEYYSAEVFAIYAPNPRVVVSAHSIYFQALGEHGWPGLALFLAILAQIWRTAGRIRKLGDSVIEFTGFALFGRMAQVSLVGFCVGGAFVNVGNWDFIYYILVLLLSMERLIQAQSIAVVAPKGPGSVSNAARAPAQRKSARQDQGAYGKGKHAHS